MAKQQEPYPVNPQIRRLQTLKDSYDKKSQALGLAICKLKEADAILEESGT